MQIPSVSGMFQAKLGAYGVSRSNAEFSQEYAAALEGTAANANESFFEMKILPSSQTATQKQALGWTPAQVFYTAPEAIKAYSSSMAAGTSAQGSAAKGEALVTWARQYVGTPYVRGGEDLEKGADCSGFTQSVFKHFGVKLPRSAYRQSLTGTPVEPGELQPGDLMFFKTDDYAPVTHVAIYAGDGKILHASGVKTGVIISKLKKNWQNGDFVCAKRML